MFLRGLSPLFFSIFIQDIKKIKMLLDYGAKVNCSDSKGMSPLALAALMGSHEIVKMLIDYHAHIDFQDHAGNTALHLAYRGLPGNKCIKLLCDAGANTSIFNWQGELPDQVNITPTTPTISEKQSSAAKQKTSTKKTDSRDDFKKLLNL